MNLSRIIVLLPIVGCVCSHAFAEYKTGDTVVVVRDTKIRVGDKVMQEVSRGVGLKVQAIDGDWLWVSNQAAGWIKNHDVASPTDAIEIFTEQIRKTPHDAEVYICRGLAWFDKNELDIAIADFNEALRLDPKQASAYNSRSLCWWAKREVDKAIGDADAAIHLAPDFVSPHIVRGNALTTKHEYPHALQEFNEALKINPREATAYGLRGRVFASTGDYERAMDDFRKALAINPSDKDACNELARFYATCPVDELRDGRKA